MDKKQIFIFAALLLVVGIRLYMKYIKKNQGNIGSDTKQSGTSFPSSSKDEDYEPYSKK
ncbi:MAG TPA: hypothetical protein VFE71_08730 [Bacteroidales bacterium]|nr:hypothetical protein [Bacteroidales bacterium]